MKRYPRYDGMDGIKGFALIGIIWYHLSQRTLPGGFIGVDVFFVVSGFLLTTSLLRERERTGRIAVGRFYVRRLARLWPGMAFMIAAATSLGFLIDHDALVGMPAKSLAAVVFGSNWYEIASGGSYFAMTSPQLLRHLWFVALLAQAIVLLPLIVALLGRIRAAAARIGVAVALAALSAAGMWILYRPGDDPTRVYFGTDTHCFGLLLGMALAFAVHRHETAGSPASQPVRAAAPWLSTAALIGLILLMPRIDQNESAFRGGLVLAAVLTVVLIAGSIAEGSWMPSLFLWRPLALLGKYSYGIYLWHWPLYLLVQLLFPQLRGRYVWVVYLLTLALSVAMAALSWWMAERPVSALVSRTRLHRASDQPSAGGHPRTVSSVGSIPASAPVPEGPFASQSMPAYRPAGQAMRMPAAGARAFAVPAWLRALVTVPVVVLAVTGFAFGLMAAPAKSSVQAMLERNQSALDGQRQQRTADAATAAEAKKRAKEEAERRAKAKAEAERNLTGDQITVIGDSVTVGASPALQSLLPGIVIDAQVSRAVTTAPDIVAQMKVEGQLRRYVVVSLNTNSAATVDEFGQIADAAGDGHILVIVNGYGDRSWIPVANQAAADYVRAHPTTSMLVDWSTAIGAHPEMLSSDGIHPEPDGQNLYAATIKDTITSWIAAQPPVGDQPDDAGDHRNG